MTLKERKNHYNVKLLRRYGCLIRLKDNKVILHKGTMFSRERRSVNAFLTSEQSSLELIEK